MELHGYGTRQNTTLARKRFRELASEETSHAIAASMLGCVDSQPSWKTIVLASWIVPICVLMFAHTRTNVDTWTCMD